MTMVTTCQGLVEPQGRSHVSISHSTTLQQAEAEGEGRVGRAGRGSDESVQQRAAAAAPSQAFTPSCTRCQPPARYSASHKLSPKGVDV